MKLASKFHLILEVITCIFIGPRFFEVSKESRQEKPKKNSIKQSKISLLVTRRIKITRRSKETRSRLLCRKVAN